VRPSVLARLPLLPNPPPPPLTSFIIYSIVSHTYYALPNMILFAFILFFFVNLRPGFVFQ
jgi:hypothetical protein